MIVGLGKTGISCARHLAGRGASFAVLDDQPREEAVAELRSIAPGVPVRPVAAEDLVTAEEIILSPGVPMTTPAIQEAIAAGVRVTGDIAMFAELAAAPVVAITGSNGKSTVTAMVGAMAAACGVDAGVGGNIGTPALDLLDGDHDLFVLELSSYQLETATHLESRVATVLNLFPDHLDRYDSAAAYFETKAAVYRRCERAVVNRDIDFGFDLANADVVLDFGVGEPGGQDSFGITRGDGRTYLNRGMDRLVAVDELPVRGRHNHLNALAALAIGTALEWDATAMVAGLQEFAGLPHRCELVATLDGVHYINDSKSTNVGSTLAALEGMSGTGEIELILGGQDKGGDFGALAPVISRSARRVHVFGQDRERIAAMLRGSAELDVFETLADVMAHVGGSVTPGVTVLFSPGCASLDQFDNFEARGEAFKALVAEMEGRP